MAEDSMNITNEQIAIVHEKLISFIEARRLGTDEQEAAMALAHAMANGSGRKLIASALTINALMDGLKNGKYRIENLEEDYPSNVVPMPKRVQ